MEKVGILGGTFDPVHYGHLYLARQARDEIGLTKLLFMPAKLQPFKLDREIADSADRLEMVRLAIAGEPRMEVSDFELSKMEISYSINTLRAVKRMEPADAVIYFIIGTDAFLKINKWKHAEELLTEYAFIIGGRPGYQEKGLGDCIEFNRNVYNTTIRRIHNRQALISSTDIKARIHRGEAIDGLVPAAVERYIYDNGLYQGLY